jgi:hypothetical protein
MTITEGVNSLVDKALWVVSSLGTDVHFKTRQLCVLLERMSSSSSRQLS